LMGMRRQIAVKVKWLLATGFYGVGVLGVYEATQITHPLQGIIILVSLVSFAVAWGVTRI
jgi:hypothetical protein